MQQVEIADLMNIKGITESEIALRVGCSVSLISKLKNNHERITDETQRKFKEAFPNYELVNSKIYWKAKYEEEHETVLELMAEIATLKDKIDDYEYRLTEIGKITRWK